METELLLHVRAQPNPELLAGHLEEDDVDRLSPLHGSSDESPEEAAAFTRGGVLHPNETLRAARAAQRVLGGPRGSTAVPLQQVWALIKNIPSPHPTPSPAR